MQTCDTVAQSPIPSASHGRSEIFINLFGVLHRCQHCTGHIMTSSWEGRGTQYIQLVKVLYCKLPTNGKQLPTFPLEVGPGTKPQSQRWETRVLPLCHRGPFQKCSKLLSEALTVSHHQSPSLTHPTTVLVSECDMGLDGAVVGYSPLTPEIAGSNLGQGSSCWKVGSYWPMNGCLQWRILSNWYALVPQPVNYLSQYDPHC